MACNCKGGELREDNSHCMQHHKPAYRTHRCKDLHSSLRSRKEFHRSSPGRDRSSCDGACGFYPDVYQIDHLCPPYAYAGIYGAARPHTRASTSYPCSSWADAALFEAGAAIEVSQGGAATHSASAVEHHAWELSQAPIRAHRGLGRHIQRTHPPIHAPPLASAGSTRHHRSRHLAHHHNHIHQAPRTRDSPPLRS